MGDFQRSNLQVSIPSSLGGVRSRPYSASAIVSNSTRPLQTSPATNAGQVRRESLSASISQGALIRGARRDSACLSVSDGVWVQEQSPGKKLEGHRSGLDGRYGEVSLAENGGTERRSKEGTSARQRPGKGLEQGKRQGRDLEKEVQRLRQALAHARGFPLLGRGGGVGSGEGQRRNHALSGTVTPSHDAPLRSDADRNEECVSSVEGVVLTTEVEGPVCDSQILYRYSVIPMGEAISGPVPLSDRGLHLTTFGEETVISSMFEVNKSGTGTGAVREDHVDGDQEDRKNRIRMKYGIVRGRGKVRKEGNEMEIGAYQQSVGKLNSPAMSALRQKKTFDQTVISAGRKKFVDL